MVGPVLFETGSFLPQNRAYKICTFNVNCLKRECLSLILIADDKNISNPLQAGSIICAECPPGDG